MDYVQLVRDGIPELLVWDFAWNNPSCGSHIPTEMRVWRDKMHFYFRFAPVDFSSLCAMGEPVQPALRITITRVMVLTVRFPTML